MTIKSITCIVGDKKTGKSTIAEALYKGKPYTVKLDENYRFDFPKLLSLINTYKNSTSAYDLIIVGETIYQLVDYDFGNIDRFEIKCTYQAPLRFDLPPKKPLFD